MKKIIVWILFMFICVLNISAIKYDASIPLANNYGKEFEDKKYYLIIDDNIPFGYNTNGVYVDSKFVDGGYLNLVEFQISQDIKGNTYLFDGRDYYTMTEEEDKVYQIKWNSDKFNLITKTTDSNVKITEFVKSKTKVVGIGTYSNPWKFVKPNMFFVNVTVGDHACINDICPLKTIEIEVEPNSDVSVSIKTDDGYAFDSAVCTNSKEFSYDYIKGSNKAFFTVKNVDENTECSLSFLKVPDKSFAYKESEQSMTIIYPGYYTIDAYGAKGNNGGNGGRATGVYYFDKGDNVSVITGGTNGYNGGGAGGHDGYNGGGATHVKDGDKYIMIAAGGGGGTGATAGGSGTGAGGASTNNGNTAYNVPSGYKNGQAGAAGTNGGGGGNSYIYYYGTGCSNCKTGSPAQCVGGYDSVYSSCKSKKCVASSQCYSGSMFTYDDCCTQECVGGYVSKWNDCKSMTSNTCKYGCDSNTTGYNGGKGGHNSFDSNVKNQSSSGSNSGDGKVMLTYYGEVYK